MRQIIDPARLHRRGGGRRAPPALAAPEIVSTQVTGSALSEEGLTISVVAKDPDAAVNAVRLAFGEGEGGFGESACRIGRDGEPQAAGALGPGRSVRFEVPFRPTLVRPARGGDHGRLRRVRR